MKCERCGKTQSEYSLWDYCAKCSKNLCLDCMDNGCCGQVPALSGSEEDHSEDDSEDDS